MFVPNALQMYQWNTVMAEEWIVFGAFNALIQHANWRQAVVVVHKAEAVSERKSLLVPFVHKAARQERFTSERIHVGS